MNILITGAKGFVGKNLVANLNNIKKHKNKTRPGLKIDEIFEYDLENSPEQLDEYCSKANFVFNLAGVNRSMNPEAFEKANYGFASELLDSLRSQYNNCPVMLSSSTQATLIGRYNGDYGRSKKAGEELFFSYERETGSKVLVYRFPNIFGKWCRPNYNSVIATFCNAIANDLEFKVNEWDTELELLYIDDIIEEMFDALEGKEHHCEYEGLEVVPFNNGRYCYVPNTYKATLKEVINLLKIFKTQPSTLTIPPIPDNSFTKKLYSTYLSYLPASKIEFPLHMNTDDRGSFTELLKTESNGQVSVNISKPGIVKGHHWHNTKWEIFFVVAGHGMIEERKIGTDEVIRFEVSGEKIQAIHIIPGYTHNIINLSETENLVTVMWASEIFDDNHPDTFGEKV